VLIVFVSVAIVTVVAAVVIRAALRDPEPRVDCSTVRFERGAWRDTRGSPSRRQRLGRELAACGTLVGASRREVRRMLGAPDDSDARGLGYELGPDGLGIDSEFLDVRFADGAVSAVGTYDG
jgi:hypothetical protein